MPEDLQQFADTCTAVAAAFAQGVDAMKSLCNTKIAPATIGCDENYQPTTKTALVGVHHGRIIVIAEAGSFTEEQLQKLGREYRDAVEKSQAVVEVPTIPDIHLPMQPHEHRNDALPYLMRNKSKYSVPNNFKGKHVPYRQKHHQRKTGRR